MFKKICIKETECQVHTALLPFLDFREFNIFQVQASYLEAQRLEA